MDMVDATALEMVRKVKGITRALLCLHTGAIFPLVPVDQVLWPFAVRFRVPFRNLQDFLRRRVVNWRSQTGDVLVAQTGKGWIDRADLEFQTEPFQRQHLRVAKRLRKHGIPGVKIAEPHWDRM